MRYFLAMLLLAIIALPTPAPAAAADARCFPETGYCISGAFRSYWERNGGLTVFGYPISDVYTREIEGTWTGPVQWFERDRLEDHGNEGLGVMAGRLGARALELQGRPWQQLAPSEGAPAGCRYFAETGHSLCGAFLRTWQEGGGLARFGFPLSEPMEESLVSGDGVWTGTVQYFERRRMELHSELAGTPYEVLLGLLGVDVFGYAEALKCAQAPSPLSPLAAARGYACAASLPRLRVPIATQPFEHGLMIWVSDPLGAGGTIYAIYPRFAGQALTWASYPDTWSEGATLPVESPPPGLLAPTRGFGLVWESQPALRAAIGWATAPEQGDRGDAQRFHVNSGPGNLQIVASPAAGRTYLLAGGQPRPSPNTFEIISSTP